MEGDRDLAERASADERTRLFKVREALLNLHKELLHVERKRYEQRVGPVSNEFEFFRLVTSDPSFAWIGPMTTLIVQIDEKVASKEPITAVEVDGLYAELVQCWRLRTTLRSRRNTPNCCRRIRDWS